METVIYFFLGITSVVSFGFIIERGLALRWSKIVPREVAAGVDACRNPEDVPKLRTICEIKMSPLSRLLLTATDHLKWPKPDAEDAVQSLARHEIVRLERGLVVLEVAVGISPLLGLVGTIYGMMSLFSGLGQTGMSDNATLAHNIGLILHATLLGLLIAIPSLIAWSYYTKKVEALGVEMEALCGEFLRRQYREDAKK